MVLEHQINLLKQFLRIMWHWKLEELPLENSALVMLNCNDNSQYSFLLYF